jgi:hypothetical protein
MKSVVNAVTAIMEDIRAFESRGDPDVDPSSLLALRERAEAALGNLVAASRTHAMSAGMSVDPAASHVAATVTQAGRILCMPPGVSRCCLPQHVTQVRRPSAQLPIIVTNPPMVSYKNPVIASPFKPYGASHFIAQQTLESDEIAAWNAQVYARQQQPEVICPQYHQSPRSSVFGTASSVDMFGNYQRQQPQPIGIPARHHQETTLGGSQPPPPLTGSTQDPVPSAAPEAVLKTQLPDLPVPAQASIISLLMTTPRK